MGENQVEITKTYYDSSEADNFYSIIWGGDDIHIGIYDNPSLNIKSASRNTIKVFVSMLPSIGGNTKILDLGAGYGGTARYIAWHYGCKVDCLNISQVENAKNIKKTSVAGLDQLVKVFEGNMEELPFEDESYDIVLSLDSLLHCSDRVKAIDEVARVLKPKGWFIFSDIFQGEGVPKVAMKSLLDRLPIASLETINTYQDMLGKKGFKLILDRIMPEQLVNHYTQIQKELKDQKAHIVQKSGEEFVKNTTRGLNQWIRAGKKGQLSWGIMLFQKV